MSIPNKKDLAKTIRKLSRQSQLEREKMVGKPRAKTFGGKPSVQSDRRAVKNTLRKVDHDGEKG